MVMKDPKTTIALLSRVLPHDTPTSLEQQSDNLVENQSDNHCLGILGENDHHLTSRQTYLAQICPWR